MPGIGKIASASLISKLPELGYISSKQASALVGVASINRESSRYKRFDEFKVEGIKYALFCTWPLCQP
jgi:hypothetical protein